MARVYDVDDRGSVIRLWYFLATVVPTLDQFLSLAARGRTYEDDPVAAYRAQGISAWATESIARRQGRVPRLNRGRWHFIAGLDLSTEGTALRIERTGRKIGHFTVFGEPQALHDSVRRIVPL